MWSIVCIYLTITFALSMGNDAVIFQEEFDDTWRDRWVDSTSKAAEQGKWELTAGKFFNDPEKDKGIKTTQDARFYGISAKFPKSFDNKDKTLVIQFQVKHEQSIDCGGGYLKIFPSDLDQPGMHGESPYHIMFGPDICGYSTKKVHVIFNYKGKNLLTKKDIKCKEDELSHLYTLILKPDNTYEVKIDGEKAESGTLEDDWDFLAPKKIKDPEAKKPDDWDDREMIDDENDKKPDDWDKPKHVTDPDAKKPDDWDDEMDGEWEAPMIDNPEYKGDWKPKQVKNPNYKGTWVHPEIDNPEYSPDAELYHYSDLGAIGFDLWQVKSGSIFDNVLLTSDEAYAHQFAKDTFFKLQEVEKKKKEEADEIERKKQEAEDKKREEEEKNKKAEGKDDDKDEDDDDEDDEAKETAEQPPPTPEEPVVKADETGTDEEKKEEKDEL